MTMECQPDLAPDNLIREMVVAGGCADDSDSYVCTRSNIRVARRLGHSGQPALKATETNTAMLE